MLSNPNGLAGDPSVRASGLGGSDCAVVFGLNPYKTRYQLYLEKVGELPPADLSGNEAVQWGIRMEDLVAQVYAERMEVKVRRNNRTLRHREHSHLMAHLDREVVGQDIILECKTAGEYMSSQWGAEFTSQVPEHYLMQCLHYLLVTGKSEAHLAVLIGGNKHRIYVIKAADFAAEMAMIVPTLTRFWERVQTQTPPDLSSLEDISLRFPTDDGEAVQASPSDLENLAELEAVRERQKALDEREKELRFAICLSIGDAAKLVQGKQTLATYKGQASSRIDSAALREAHPDIADQYMKSHTTRVFRVNTKKGE